MIKATTKNIYFPNEIIGVNTWRITTIYNRLNSHNEKWSGMVEKKINGTWKDFAYESNHRSEKSALKWAEDITIMMAN